MHLWQVLGYDKVAEDISKRLQSKNAGMVLLEGPPGVGKSWLAKGIGASWQEGAGCSIVAEGDNARSDFAFYPFDTAMAVLSSRWKKMTPHIAATSKAAESLLGTGGLLTYAIQGIATLKKLTQKRKTLFLGDREQEIFAELERLGEKKPILLIADNLHWWDKNSLLFLRELFKPDLLESFPFLKNLKVLAVRTTEKYQPVIYKDAYGELLKSTSVTQFSLKRIEREMYNDVLISLGGPSGLNSKTVDLIFSLSGGHLALAQRSATRLVQGENDSFLKTADADEFIKSLLHDRFSMLGNIGDKILDVLRIAAVLGLVFRVNEISCASEIGHHEMTMLLRHCSDEKVIEFANRSCSFTHDIYRQFFLNSHNDNPAELHKRLSYCFRLLRPAEYAFRCLNELETGQIDEATALAALAALQNIREGKQWKELPLPVLSLLESQNMVPVLGIFLESMRLLGKYQHRKCLVTLDRLPKDLAKPLLAEADYIRGMCRMSTRTEYDREIGRSLLSAWEGYEKEEPEIGIRLARLLLYGMSHLIDKTPGRELEGKIRQLLWDRVSYDSAAKDDLYIMDRCSGSLYQTDIALVRNSEAAAYFAPAEGQTIIRRPLEYYRCLVNLGANYISNGRYDDAEKTYIKLETLIDKFSTIQFPRIDFARNNALLAAFRLDQCSASEAVERQKDIINNDGVDGDPFYTSNALSVYLCLDGRYGEAITIWDEIENLLRKRNESVEPSMEYLIRANRYAAYFLAGENKLFPHEWEDLKKVVTSVAYVFRPALLRRHELLGEVFKQPPISPAKFDSCLIDKNKLEFGPMWESLGRGFRMPEVEFWREN